MMEKIALGIITAVGYLFFAALVMLAVGALFAFPVMWIWNWMIPELFGLPALTFWQAFWGTFLTKLLFTNSTTVKQDK